MSKAAQIRKLYAQGLGTREIADLVGCRVEYVRVAGRQRNLPGGVSVAQAKYEANNPDYVERRKKAHQRYRQTPAARKRRRVVSARWEAENREWRRQYKRNLYLLQKQKSQQPPAV